MRKVVGIPEGDTKEICYSSEHFDIHNFAVFKASLIPFGLLLCSTKYCRDSVHSTA